MKSILLLAMIAFLSVCSVGTEPTVKELSLEFQAEKLQGVEAPEVIVTGGDQKVIVQGGLSTPCIGYTLSGEAVEGNTITLRVIANLNQPNGACFTVVEHFAYRAVLRDLPSGTYQVRVLHVFKQWDNDPNPEVREVEVATVQVR